MLAHYNYQGELHMHATMKTGNTATVEGTYKVSWGLII